MWDLTIHPSWGPASLLAHYPVSASDTICNSPSPLLSNIIRFGPYHFQSHGFKMRLLGRGFHTLIKNVSFPSQPMWDLTIHPSWGPASLLAHYPVFASDTICNSPSPLLSNIVRFGPYHFQSHSCKTSCNIAFLNFVTFVQTSQLGNQLNMTCLSNGRSGSYSLANSNSSEAQQICTQLCS